MPFHSFDIRMARERRQARRPPSGCPGILIPAYRRARKFKRPGMHFHARTAGTTAMPERTTEERDGQAGSIPNSPRTPEQVAPIFDSARFPNHSLQRKYILGARSRITNGRVDILSYCRAARRGEFARQQRPLSSRIAPYASPCRQLAPQI